MSIDVKKLLYSFKKLQVSLANIQESIKREQSKREYPSCVAGYSDDIRGIGGLPSSQTERYALFNVELDDNVQYLKWDQEEHEYVVGLIESAFKTLPLRQQQLIRLAYFDGVEADRVAWDMGISLSRFYHYQSLALNGIDQCLNGGKIFANRLIPMKNNKNRSKNSGVLNELSML